MSVVAGVKYHVSNVIYFSFFVLFSAIFGPVGVLMTITLALLCVMFSNVSIGLHNNRSLLIADPMSLTVIAARKVKSITSNRDWIDCLLGTCYLYVKTDDDVYTVTGLPYSEVSKLMFSDDMHFALSSGNDAVQVRYSIVIRKDGKEYYESGVKRIQVENTR